MSQCERCGSDMTEEEIEENFQEHDCNQVLADRAEARAEAYS